MPLFSVALMLPPPLRPCEASYKLVLTLNSCMASGFGKGVVGQLPERTIDITNSSSTTLFQGSFTSGSVMVLNGITFINAVGNKVSVTLQIAHGAVSGDTFVTPEPGTLGLLGTGLVGIAGLVRRKFKAA